MKAVDTETTGLDPWHGSKPFLVTIHNEQRETHYWEWNVDPITRQPYVPEEDKQEIRKELAEEELVFLNPKFDVRMLETIGIDNTYGWGWDWSKTHDIGMGSHLINSQKPRNLTYQALYYCNLDISKYEKHIKECTEKARRFVRKQFPNWRIASRDLPELPSALGTVWKNDLWLSRALEHAMVATENLPLGVEPSEWASWVVQYANIDVEVTYLIYLEQQKIIQMKGLEKLYQQRLKALPIIYQMESVGITLSSERLDELTQQYQQESGKSGKILQAIAQGYNYDLELPKSGNNGSLTTFVFDVMELEVVKKSKKTGKPSLDKEALSHYQSSLSPRSKQGRFIEHLLAKRKRDTAVNYMESYRRFMKPLNAYGMKVDDSWFLLHPSVNPTGPGTLRSSSQNPNEQNISKKEGFNLRYAFGPAPGREWWSIDYDNLELRIPAYECQEPAMLELFENPKDPPYYGSYHLLVFSILYPDLFDQYGAGVKDRYKSTLYQYTKNGNFAELYGAVDTKDGNSTADRAFHFPGAQAIVSKKLKKKAQLNADWIAFANEHGYVETMPDRTVDPDQGYPLHCPVSSWGKISPTIPLNYHVSGTACWVKNQAMIKVHEYLTTLNAPRSRQNNPRDNGYFIIADIHDELLFDFPYKPNKGNLPKIRKVQKLMESCGDDIGVPLTCGIDYHPENWSVSA